VCGDAWFLEEAGLQGWEAGVAITGEKKKVDDMNIEAAAISKRTIICSDFPSASWALGSSASNKYT
jgi:hypothetical protein